MVQKIPSVFFCKHQLVTVLVLIYDSYKVCLSKTVCGISHFDSFSVLIKFIFLFNKMHGIFEFLSKLK